MWYVYAEDGTKSTVRCEDMIKVAKLFDDPEYRKVWLTRLSEEVSVSTVFMMLDHGFKDVPVLFETMVFGGPMDGYTRRYHTYDEAMEGHHETVATVCDGVD